MNEIHLLLRFTTTWFKFSTLPFAQAILVLPSLDREMLSLVKLANCSP